MARWINLIGYQLVWFAAVIGAARGQPLLGPTAATLFICLQLSASRRPRADVGALLLALTLGVAIDGGLKASGSLQYASPSPSLLAPVWILAIWAAFGMTLNHSLIFLQGRVGLATFLGAIGAPLAYLAAARGFNVVSFAQPAWMGLLILALSWAFAMYAFELLRKRPAKSPVQP
jgi:hypothetical protein